MKTNELIIEAAVAWWAKHLESPEYSDRSNGGLGGFDSILMTYAKLSAKQSRSSPDVQKFKEVLTGKINTFFSKYEDRSFTLSTDWSPEGALSEACAESNNTGLELPSKTIMYIDPIKQTVRVSRLGSDLEMIYPK